MAQTYVFSFIMTTLYLLQHSFINVQHIQKNIKNLTGTILFHFNEIEKETASYQQIVEELKTKHTAAGRYIFD